MITVSSWRYFLYLLQGVGEFLGYFGLVTYPLFFLTLLAVGFSINARRRWIACLAPGLIPFVILWIGVAFVRGERTAWGHGLSPPLPWFESRPEQLLGDVIGFLAFFHVPLAAILAWHAKGSRISVVMCSLSWAWVSMMAAAMAEMSFTGNWL